MHTRSRLPRGNRSFGVKFIKEDAGATPLYQPVELELTLRSVYVEVPFWEMGFNREVEGRLAHESRGVKVRSGSHKLPRSVEVSL